MTTHTRACMNTGQIVTDRFAPVPAAVVRLPGHVDAKMLRARRKEQRCRPIIDLERATSPDTSVARSPISSSPSCVRCHRPSCRWIARRGGTCARWCVRCGGRSLDREPLYSVRTFTVYSRYGKGAQGHPHITLRGGRDRLHPSQHDRAGTFGARPRCPACGDRDRVAPPQWSCFHPAA